MQHPPRPLSLQSLPMSRSAPDCCDSAASNWNGGIYVSKLLASILFPGWTFEFEIDKIDNLPIPQREYGDVFASDGKVIAQHNLVGSLVSDHRAASPFRSRGD